MDYVNFVILTASSYANGMKIPCNELIFQFVVLSVLGLVSCQRGYEYALCILCVRYKMLNMHEFMY